MCPERMGHAMLWTIWCISLNNEICVVRCRPQKGVCQSRIRVMQNANFNVAVCAIVYRCETVNRDDDRGCLRADSCGQCSAKWIVVGARALGHAPRLSGLHFPGWQKPHFWRAWHQALLVDGCSHRPAATPLTRPEWLAVLQTYARQSPERLDPTQRGCVSQLRTGQDQRIRLECDYWHVRTQGSRAKPRRPV